MAETGSSDYQRKAHFTFIWDIENSFELFLAGSAESPTFITEFTERIKWIASVRFNSERDMIELGIRRTDLNGPDSIEIEFELSVLRLNGTVLRTPTSKKQFKCRDECWLKLEDFDEISKNAEADFIAPFTIRCRMWKTGTEILKPDTCFARTRLGMDRRCFIWPIKEFSSLQSGQKRTHVVKPSLNGSPTLILDLFLSERDFKTFLNIKVTNNYGTRCTSGHQNVCFGILSLLDSNGRVVHSMNNELCKITENSEIYTFHEFFEKEKLGKDGSSLVVHDDTLFIRCSFINGANAVWSRIERYTHLVSKKAESLEMNPGEQDESCTASCLFKKAFEELYGDESLSDVSLRAGKKSFTAHKNVLSVRSPVFKAMFSHDMKEKSSKLVDIPDFNDDTLSRLLIYIYKNTVEELQWKSAMDLYRAADKYQLLDLRKKCSFFLESNISTINVCSLLSLGVMHEDGVLRKAAEDFILEHDDEVFDSVEWKNFREENFRLAIEMTEKIIRLIKRRNR